MNDFASPTHMNWNAGGLSGTVQYGRDENLLVMFYNKSVENAAQSLSAGRRVCENKIYVRIQHPGEAHNIIDRPVSDEDKRRFQNQWTKFLHNRTQIPEGSPIDLLFPNNPAFSENLRANGIHTIEQCAALSALAIENLGRGGQECVNRAKKYLDSANSGKGFHILQKEIEDLKREMSTKDLQISQLMSQLKQFLQRSEQGVAPAWAPGYDPQTERINANHISSDLPKSDVAKVIIDAIPAEPMFNPEEAFK